MRRMRQLLQRGFRDVLFWILALAMLGLVSIVVYTNQAYRKAAAELILRRDEQLAILASTRLQAELSNFTDSLESIARLQHPSRPGQQDEITQPGIGLQIFDGGLVRINSQGTVIATLPERREIIGQNWANRDYFQAILGEQAHYISNFSQDGPSENPAIAVSVPILDDINNLEGVLVGFFQLGETNISALYASIIRLRLGQTGYSYIVDAVGKIIYDSRQDRIGHSLSTARLSLIRSVEPYGATLIDEPDNRKLVIAYAPIPGTGWTLITEDDWAILTQSFNRYSNVLTLSFVAALSLPPIMITILRKQSVVPWLSEAATNRSIERFTAFREELHSRNMPLLPGWSILYRRLDGKQGGREFSDVRIMLDGNLVIILGEAQVEELPGSIVATTARSLLIHTAGQGKSPGESLQECNATLCADQPEPVQIRCLLFQLNPSDGSYEFAQANFPPILQLGDRVVRETASTGSAIGVAPETEFESTRGYLGRGETLLLISPSLLELMNFIGQRFGEHILPDLLDETYKSPEDMLDEIYEAIKRFTKHFSSLERDAMLLIVTRMVISG